jgi:hypothetical protein
MSNILIFLDKPAKHVHFCPECGYHINYRSRYKVGN